MCLVPLTLNRTSPATRTKPQKSPSLSFLICQLHFAPLGIILWRERCQSKAKDYIRNNNPIFQFLYQKEQNTLNATAKIMRDVRCLQGPAGYSTAEQRQLWRQIGSNFCAHVTLGCYLNSLSSCFFVYNMKID
jgi:hypothetical protein